MMSNQWNTSGIQQSQEQVSVSDLNTAELLVLVAEPDTPEERNEAWNEIEARMAALVSRCADAERERDKALRERDEHWTALCKSEAKQLKLEAQVERLTRAAEQDMAYFDDHANERIYDVELFGDAFGNLRAVLVAAPVEPPTDTLRESLNGDLAHSITYYFNEAMLALQDGETTEAKARVAEAREAHHMLMRELGVLVAPVEPREATAESETPDGFKGE